MLKGGTSVETRYVLAAIERGTIITSITGSGQVSTSDQIDIRPKTSGDVTYVGVKNGQEVRAGQLLVQLDSTDAKKAVEDAGIALKNAEIQFEKWLLNQNDDTDRLNKSIEDAHKNLERTYQNVFNSISSIFLDWPDTIDDLRDVLYEDNVGGSSQQNLGAYQDLVDDRYTSGEATHVYRAKTDFENAEATYRTNFNSYKALGYDPSNEEVEKLLDETIETAKLISFAVRSELNLLDFVANDLRRQDRNIPSQIISYQSTLSSYVNQINSNVTSLMNSQDSIDNSRETIVETQKDLEFSEKYNPYDLADQQNSIKQREAALSDAKNKLSDYNVYAPFAGVIAKVNVKRGDSVSGSTTIATLISQHQIVEISLNEIDIANVRVGQKATITFDSVEELTITGEILEVGLLGTVSQGVVTYDVTIGFDTQDERIKPGMSASAVIITDAKQNVVMIPNSAVKFAGGANYVEVPGDTSNASQLLANAANSTGVILNSVPQQRMVELGLANDSFTEVLSGLQEGDVVIIRTVTATSSSQTTTQTNSLFPVGGSRGAGGGGNIRTFSR
jgi:HlyD family secretion protein